MKDNHPVHITTLNRGCDRDTDPEISCSQPGTGVYLDGHNTRPVSIDSNTGANEKIKGEELLYPNNKGLTNYSCIGSTIVIDYLVEFWADNAGTGPGICTVDGVVVLNSSDFELRITHPLQMDKNESPLNPEVFITDFRVPPYIFNVEDMVDSLTSDPTKYFTAFDPLLYQVNLQSPLDRPVFVELINVGGGGGLPVGQYSYSIRYSSEEGDRTNWSVDTPLIPIMQGLSSDSRQYPWARTYGGPPNPSSVTSFAPHLRFRVNNIYNYDFIEVRRTSFNKGAGITFVPQGVIVAKIAVDKGEISVREYIDPADSNSNIIISDEEANQQLAEIEAAKAIHYFDRRTVLMNVKLASKESELQFLEINEKQGFPLIDKIGNGSHKDPWNHVHRRSYMGGEKYGYAIVGFDGVGSSGFATKMDQLKNFQYPNRRDEISAETSNYSLSGTVRAATTQVNHVGQTHEVFDLAGAVDKNDICSFKNIVRSGTLLGLTGSRSLLKVKEDCDEDAGEVENHGARVNAGIVTVSYQPFNPTAQNDNDVTGHDYIVNPKVFTGVNVDVTCSNVGDDKIKHYRPLGFGPDYYAHGMMIAGVTNFPKWMKAFSVVRTEAAGRVVCQGLGFYALTKAQYKVIGNASLAGKSDTKLWFYSPDIEQGIVSSNTLNDIIDNPQNYAIQMVSPLGFFSEVYSAEDNLISCNRDRIIDMVSYVRMIRDSNDPSAINPAEDSGMGIPEGTERYVDYDKYRNTGQNPQFFNNDPNKGNKVYSLASVKRKVEGRGQFIELETVGGIYGTQSTGGSTERQFEDQGLKNFTEPMYIINIIRTGANVPDVDIQKFKPTDHYQKLESIIGRGNGLPDQSFILVDERWEDCIPSPFAGQFGSNIDRFIYMKSPDGTYKKWINVTYKTAGQISVITSAINGAGVYNTDIYGVYTHTNINNQSRFFQLNFSIPGFYPPEDHFVIVKYDNTAPIRVFGGDTYIGETIFAPIDTKADANDDAAETQFAFGIGFPYFKWKLNPRYYTIRKAGASLNVIQDELQFQLGYIRQLVAMFCVEARSGIHLSYNLQSPNQFFPMINYVIRPNRWDDGKNTTENGVFSAYTDDYGDEIGNWQWGGFRFLQQINPDYSCEAPNKYFSKPAFGFVEKTEFITRIMWSLPRAINVQNSPGLRTFPANNSFDIDDNFGEIKFAYDDTTSNGENLYAITEKGICMLLTKKSILSDLNAGEIAYMAADGFVRAQYWRNKEIGMMDEMWRSAVVSFVPVGEGPEQTRVKALFFANARSVFRFMGNQVMDIWGVYNKVYDEGLAKLTPGYTTKVVSGYNTFYQEYWLYLKNEEVDNCFVYGQATGMWYGTNDFKFDKITSSPTVVYGSRNLETYELNVGYKINGVPITSRLLGGSSPEQFLDKEFIAIRINTLEGQKPTSVKFYKELDGSVQCELAQVIQGSLYMKNYRGYEGQIPRIQAAINPARPRFQQRLIIWEIIHNLESEFKIVSVGVQYKPLKIK
jgi:hypothetical protein